MYFDRQAKCTFASQLCCDRYCVRDKLITFLDCERLCFDRFIVSTGGIRWIIWFSVRYAAAAGREIFSFNALRGKLHQLGSPNLGDIFIGR